MKLYTVIAIIILFFFVAGFMFYLHVAAGIMTIIISWVCAMVYREDEPTKG